MRPQFYFLDGQYLIIAHRLQQFAHGTSFDIPVLANTSRIVNSDLLFANVYIFAFSDQCADLKSIKDTRFRYLI